MPDLAQLTQWQLTVRRFRRHRLALACLYFLAALYFVALFAPFFAPYPPGWRDTHRATCPPMLPAWNWQDGWHTPLLRQEIDPETLRHDYVRVPDRHVPLGFLVRGEPYRLLGPWGGQWRFFGVDRVRADALGLAPSEQVWFGLGADRFGQDLLSRLIQGSRVSLSIGLVGVAMNFFLGVLLGGISGYFGGRIDNLIQRTIEVVNAFPNIPLWLALAAVIPASWSSLQTYFAITVLLSLLSWTGLARVVRGKILSLREEDYAVAARLMGASHSRIILRHLVPGFTSHIVVALTLAVPGMILGETALSFLGLGLRPPVVSWGVLLQDCLNLQVIANYPWLLMPVVMITATVLAFNFLGDGLRDAADPHG
jgi:peptide/nickel transport system permease protein